MGKLSIEQALSKAKSHAKKGELAEAKSLYATILKAFPNNKKAQQGLMALGGDQRSATEQGGPPQAAIDQLVGLYRQGQLELVVDQAQDLIAQFPKAIVLWNMLGASAVQIGRLDQAVQAFREIISLNPNQANAYYNLGNALKDQGKLEEAIEAYSKALAIKPDYEAALNNVVIALKTQGKSGEKRIKAVLETYNKTQTLKIENANSYYSKALGLLGKGKLEEAIEAYRKALAIKPDYAEAYLNMGVALQKQGQLKEAIEAYREALAIKPDYANAYYNVADALQEQDKLEEAIEAYRKAIAIKPDYADAYYNVGIVLKDQGQLEEAIEACRKAIAIKPDYADAYLNMGNALKDQGQLEEAIEACRKAIAIKPDYAGAYNNIGNCLKEQGQLEEAIEAYSKALAIKPDYAEAIENRQSLGVQLFPIISNFGYKFDIIEAQGNAEIVARPHYQIQHAIKTYVAGDFAQADIHNNNFKACNPTLFVGLTPQNKIFCNAYSSFIGKLLDAKWDEKPDTKNKVYHLGESHCLSYAHRNITIDELNFRIVPRITFGAKAFHFCRTKQDSFKAITRAHFLSLPKKSKVFISFGEIDCRSNEGFISAARKFNKPLEELIDYTTSGYVKWFWEQNASQRHHLLFINVPAPVYDESLTSELNSEVARTVSLFNAALKRYSLLYGFDTVDVFKFTASKEGFSNGLFHVDKNHLGAKALPEIQKQISQTLLTQRSVRQPHS